MNLGFAFAWSASCHKHAAILDGDKGRKLEQCGELCMQPRSGGGTSGTGLSRSSWSPGTGMGSGNLGKRSNGRAEDKHSLPSSLCLLDESLHFPCIRFLSSNIGDKTPAQQLTAFPLQPLAELHPPTRCRLSSLSSTPEHPGKEAGIHNRNGNRKEEVRGLVCERQQCGAVEASSAMHRSPELWTYLCHQYK